MHFKNEQPTIFRMNIKHLTFATALMLLLTVFSVHAVVPDFTYISEDIVDAVWTFENSPYIVTNNINIISSLYIDAGVEVHFQGSFGIEVNPDAIFRATGGEDVGERILFTSSSVIWQGLRFISVNDTSILRNCDILNVATAIHCIQSDIEITGCRIEARSVAINCNQASPYIHHNPVIKVIGESDVPADYTAISIYDRSAPFIFENEWIQCSANHASNATGIQIWESSPQIVQNWIEVSSNNEVCGIKAEFSDDIDIQRNIIRVETSPFTRGLDFEYSTSTRIYNNDILIIGSSVNSTSGVRVDAGSSVTLINNILLGAGDGIGLAVIRSVSIDDQSGYNLIYNFTTPYSAGFEPIEGDIQDNPLFVNADIDTSSADYYLQSDSPCIDAGYPDWDDEYGTRSEIGRYSFEPADSDTVYIKEPDLRLPVKFYVRPAYPNPFNSQTRLSFELKSETMVRIAVYDIAGKMVEFVKEGNYTQGAHSICWNAERYSTGVYLLKFEAGEESHTQRLIYIP
ncbi:T9SS type A sorting domain-containing protein [bacterium]|nr:T9SS type A sorting domain-containing protein [bacterium]